jgi:hypothetical protein
MWPGSTERVLVMVHVEGISIGDAVIGALPQEERNEVRKLLYLFRGIHDANLRGRLHLELSSSPYGSSSSSG